MSRKAMITGSKGYISKPSGTDIIAEIIEGKGWSGTYVPAKYFEIKTKDDLDISINEEPMFTLLAGMGVEIEEDLVESVRVFTPEAKFYFYVKF